jgi:DNA-binding transcriptional LysR family regulator
MHASLTMLRTFEAAGRIGSFRGAALELNLSPSAVSHAIRSLEQSLGVVLFDRDGRNVRLSADGEALMRHVGRAFDDLRRGMEVVSTLGPKLLRVHSAPSFAAQWLAPRLADFLSENPAIKVRVAASTDYSRFTTDEFDVDIVYGPPRHESLVVIPLGQETVTPLCAPRLADRIRRPQDLFDQVLIDSDNKQIRWSAWFAANGLVAPPPTGMRFDRSFLAISVAASGLGVALESTRLAEKEMQERRLVAPLAGRAKDVSYVGHHLVFPRFPRQRELVHLFARWLVRELGLGLEAELSH